MNFRRAALAITITVSLASCADNTKGAKDTPSSGPKENWGTVTTAHMDCEKASHAGCFAPIVDNIAGWGGSTHTLNVADAAQKSPYCHFGADAITSGCWPASNDQIVVHCKMAGSLVRGRGNHSSDTWYKVILPEKVEGRRVWLQPSLGQSMGDSAFGWVNALWVQPSRPPVDCQE